jgi:hypothetical protein
MAVIRFQTNIPVGLRLRSTEGRPVESQFGGMQQMFSADEGNFYVSETVGAILAEQFRKLNVRPGLPIEITKAEVSKGNGRKGIEWTVATLGYAPGEQPNGTLVIEKPSELERQLAESVRQVQARKAAQMAETAAPAPAWTEALVSQTNALVDAYAQVLKHSSRHEGLVKGEDIRSIFLSAFINVTKGANGRAA